MPDLIDDETKNAWDSYQSLLKENINLLLKIKTYTAPTPPSIYDEIQITWDAYISLLKNTESPEKTHELPEYKKLYDELRIKNHEKASELLQPWLGIFELGLQWLTSVHLALNRKEGLFPKSPTTPHYRAVWALLGSASAFGTSIKNLCLDGFDTPAKSLLRTYTENLLLSIAILYDHSLGIEFTEANTDEKVKNFWHSSVSPRRLHERIIDIEKNIGFDNDLITSIKAWRQEEYEILSQSAHLSYTLAGMTVLSPALGEEEVCKSGLFGCASSNSLRTLKFAAQITCYFSMIANSKLYDVDFTDFNNCLFILEKENNLHDFIVFGKEVFTTLTTKYWDSSN